MKSRTCRRCFIRTNSRKDFFFGLDIGGFCEQVGPRLCKSLVACGFSAIRRPTGRCSHSRLPASLSRWKTSRMKALGCLRNFIAAVIASIHNASRRLWISLWTIGFFTENLHPGKNIVCTLTPIGEDQKSFKSWGCGRIQDWIFISMRKSLIFSSAFNFVHKYSLAHRCPLNVFATLG